MFYHRNSPAGISVAVVRQDGQGGWIVETKSYGNAKADGTKVTSDTRFAIGSESKVNMLWIVLCTKFLTTTFSAVRYLRGRPVGFEPKPRDSH